MPFLRQIIAELDAVIAEAKSLDVEQEEARSRPQGVIHLSALGFSGGEASERLRRGDRNAPFPLGSFPPALPFVAGTGNSSAL